MERGKDRPTPADDTWRVMPEAPPPIHTPDDLTERLEQLEVVYRYLDLFLSAVKLNASLDPDAAPWVEEIVEHFREHHDIRGFKPTTEEPLEIKSSNPAKVGTTPIFQALVAALYGGDPDDDPLLQLGLHMAQRHGLEAMLSEREEVVVESEPTTVYEAPQVSETLPAPALSAASVDVVPVPATDRLPVETQGADNEKEGSPVAGSEDKLELRAEDKSEKVTLEDLMRYISRKDGKAFTLSKKRQLLANARNGLKEDHPEMDFITQSRSGKGFSLALPREEIEMIYYYFKSRFAFANSKYQIDEVAEDLFREEQDVEIESVGTRPPTIRDLFSLIRRKDGKELSPDSLSRMLGTVRKHFRVIDPDMRLVKAASSGRGLDEVLPREELEDMYAVLLGKFEDPRSQYEFSESFIEDEPLPTVADLMQHITNRNSGIPLDEKNKSILLNRARRALKERYPGMLFVTEAGIKEGDSLKLPLDEMEILYKFFTERFSFPNSQYTIDSHARQLFTDDEETESVMPTLGSLIQYIKSKDGSEIVQASVNQAIIKARAHFRKTNPDMVFVKEGKMNKGLRLELPLSELWMIYEYMQEKFSDRRAKYEFSEEVMELFEEEGDGLYTCEIPEMARGDDWTPEERAEIERQAEEQRRQIQLNLEKQNAQSTLPPEKPKPSAPVEEEPVSEPIPAVDNEQATVDILPTAVTPEKKQEKARPVRIRNKGVNLGFSAGMTEIGDAQRELMEAHPGLNNFFRNGRSWIVDDRGVYVSLDGLAEVLEINGEWDKAKIITRIKALRMQENILSNIRIFTPNGKKGDFMTKEDALILFKYSVRRDMLFISSERDYLARISETSTT